MHAARVVSRTAKGTDKGLSSVSSRQVNVSSIAGHGTFFRASCGVGGHVHASPSPAHPADRRPNVAAFIRALQCLAVGSRVSMSEE